MDSTFFTGGMGVAEGGAVKLVAQDQVSSSSNFTMILTHILFENNGAFSTMCSYFNFKKLYRFSKLSKQFLFLQTV